MIKTRGPTPVCHGARYCVSPRRAVSQLGPVDFLAVSDTPGIEPVLTVIVLNYNGAHLLPPCLDALAKQDMPDGSMQVWVVDNDSRKDDSVAMLARDYPW